MSFGIKFMRVWMFFVQEEKLRGVSVWNVRETGGQESAVQVMRMSRLWRSGLS